MRERVGVITAHYFSGHIVEQLDGREVLESQATQVIESLRPLPSGSYYAFSAKRLGARHEVESLRQ